MSRPTANLSLSLSLFHDLSIMNESRDVVSISNLKRIRDNSRNERKSVGSRKRNIFPIIQGYVYACCTQRGVNRKRCYAIMECKGGVESRIGERAMTLLPRNLDR